MAHVARMAARRRTQRQRGVVEEHDRGDVADHQRDELGHSHPARLDDVEVDRVVEGAEQVPALCRADRTAGR